MDGPAGESHGWFGSLELVSWEKLGRGHGNDHEPDKA
jgi:hypothetical protein